jgi:hypothetical protein
MLKCLGLFAVQFLLLFCAVSGHSTSLRNMTERELLACAMMMPDWILYS